MNAADQRAVRARRPAVVAAVLGVAFLVVYAVVLANQDDVGVAWAYVVIVLAAIGGCVATAVTGRALTAAVASVLFGVCLLLGLASIGILLLPATVLSVIAFTVSRRDRTDRAPATPPAP
jgi:hypothetical protein